MILILCFLVKVRKPALRPRIIDAYDSTSEETIRIDVFHPSYIPPYFVDTCKGR